MKLADIAQQHGVTVHRSVGTSGHFAFFGDTKVVELVCGGYLIFPPPAITLEGAVFFEDTADVAAYLGDPVRGGEAVCICGDRLVMTDLGWGHDGSPHRNHPPEVDLRASVKGQHPAFAGRVVAR